MSTILTYNTLKEQMIKYPARPNETDYIDNIPFFILLAQTELSRKLNILGLQRTVQGILTPGINIIQKPSTWMANVQFKVYDPLFSDQESILKYRSRSYLSRWTITPNETGMPLFYTDYDFNNFMIYPAPPVIQNIPGIRFELIFHELYQPLDENNQQNWMTQRIPDVLFNACMAQAYIYFQTPNLKDDYRKMYLEAIEDLKKQDIVGKQDQPENTVQS